ncbi:MAG: hypothetical protein WKF56_01480, partial [Candidatus Limnocylindrales bacterium]
MTEPDDRRTDFADPHQARTIGFRVLIQGQTRAAAQTLDRISDKCGAIGADQEGQRSASVTRSVHNLDGDPRPEIDPVPIAEHEVGRDRTASGGDEHLDPFSGSAFEADRLEISQEVVVGDRALPQAGHPRSV